MKTELRERLAARILWLMTNGLCELEKQCEDCDCFDPESRGARTWADDLLKEVVQPELEKLREVIAKYDATMNWHTNCHNCAQLLDSCYAETMRAEKAETTIARVKALAERWRSEMPASVTESVVKTIFADAGERVLEALEPPEG